MFIFFLMRRRPPRSTRKTHSFPTRRSSDLLADADRLAVAYASQARPHRARHVGHVADRPDDLSHPIPQGELQGRSEEHTSELQSLMRISYAVFCLKTKHNERRSINILDLHE